MPRKQQACSHKTYHVTMAQIHKDPLSCPMKGAQVWDAHPTVFLPIMKTGKAICPYCSALYVLTDFAPEKATDITDTESE